MNKLSRWYMRNETHIFYASLNGSCALFIAGVLWLFADWWIVQVAACAYVSVKVYRYLQRESYRSLKERKPMATRTRP